MANGQYTTWRAVADTAGGTVHPQVQWGRLAGPDTAEALGGSHMAVIAPKVGSLDERSQASLMALLAEDMDAQLASCFAYAAIATVIGIRPRDDAEDCSASWDVGAIVDALPGDDPTLDLGGIAYLVLGGSVTSMPFSGQCLRIFPDSTGVLAPTSPNLMWAMDRSWAAATDPEFDSTIFGGSEHLIELIIARQDIEAVRVPPSLRLTARSDRRN
jgi:hypothetical protein